MFEIVYYQHFNKNPQKYWYLFSFFNFLQVVVEKHFFFEKYKKNRDLIPNFLDLSNDPQKRQSVSNYVISALNSTETMPILVKNIIRMPMISI